MIDELQLTILIPVIVGVVQVVKTATEIDSKYLPLLSLALGVSFSIVAGLSTQSDLLTSLFNGLIAGLSASGLYDQKDVIE